MTGFQPFESGLLYLLEKLWVMLRVDCRTPGPWRSQRPVRFSSSIQIRVFLWHEFRSKLAGEPVRRWHCPFSGHTPAAHKRRFVRIAYETIAAMAAGHAVNLLL